MIELKKYQELVDKEIESYVEKIRNKYDPFINLSYDFLNEYLLRGGKRLRAVSCIKSYEAFSKYSPEIVMPSISLELFHASSLVHDDIMDEDDLRRGKPSMHAMYETWVKKKFGPNSTKGKIFINADNRFASSCAIIQGNIIFSLGLSCINNSGFSAEIKTQAMNAIETAYRKVNEGQLLDMVNEIDKKISEEEYIKMAELKTGELFGLSLQLGAIFAGTEKKNQNLIYEYGKNIAIAFQLHDDLMDIKEDMKKGNTLGSDIMKGKMTVLMINALKKADTEERKILLNISGKSDATREEINSVIEIFEKTGAVKRAAELSQKYIEKGKSYLKKLENAIKPESYKFFSELADYMVERRI